jgi:hypothetical protein
MKGFPNQVADLAKLATAMRSIVRLTERGAQARDDGVLGQELVRAGVAGTGHRPMPVEEYIRRQLENTPSNQSFRTTARGLRELFRLLGFIRDDGDRVEVTDSGQQAASFADKEMNAEQIAFWRRIIGEMTHEGDGDSSHPYQVLLRLVGRKPGITRAKCALALEARSDSARELDRIAELADLTEDEIRGRIGVSESNWDNAKKILPKWAEQLGDVIRNGQSFVLADAPGRADAGAAAGPVPAGPLRRRVAAVPRAPRTSRLVTPQNIAQAGAQGFDEVQIPPEIDPARAAQGVQTRLDRLRRHNTIVRRLAERLAAAGPRLYENPFDIFALFDAFGILAEIKTLDGAVEDERSQVQAALSQLLYYEAFVTPADAADGQVHKVACFEQAISDAHANWLNQLNIAVIWQVDGGFRGDALAAEFLGRYIEELRR